MTRLFMPGELEGQFIDPEGRPRRLITPAGPWRRPARVTVRAGHLVAGGRGGWVRPTGAILPAFASLATAEEDRFRAFVRRYGLLGLCGCGQPYQHRIEPWGELGSCLRVVEGIDPDPDGSAFDIEAIGAWREHAHRVSDVLAAATVPPPIAARERDHAGRAPDLVVDELERWLGDGQVVPHLVRGPTGALRVEIGNGELWGLLGAALIQAALGGVPALARCASCGVLFERSGRQRADLNAWCGSDRCQRAKRAKAARDYRRRRREDPMRVLGLRGAWSLRAPSFHEGPPVAR